MPTASKTSTVQFGTRGFSNSPGVVSNEGAVDVEVSLPVGKLATAWVKTSASVAACNLTAGHGIVTGKVDVYFAAGSRYGVDAVVSTNALTFSGGTGTDFPATAAADCVVSQQVTVNFAFTYSLLKFLALINVNTSDTTGKVSADLQTSAPASVVRYVLVHQALAGGHAAVIDVANGDTNPCGSSPATIRCSNSSTTYAATLHAYALVDATP